MSYVVTGNLTCKVTISETLTNGLSSGPVGGTVSYNLAFGNGTGAGNMNEPFSLSATLAISTPVTHTLSALTDAIGRTVAFTKVRLGMIINNGTADLIVGGAATHPWLAPFGDVSDKVTIKPGGVWLFTAPGTAGLAVGSGSADQLKFDPGSTACPYKIILFGE